MIDGDLLKYNIQDRKFLVFDFEGDLNEFYSTPFQLGFSIYHGNKLIESYDYYIKWKDLYISEFVKKFAHYDPIRMQRDGKDPLEVFTNFSKYMNDESYSLVGANIFSYDCLLMYNCLKRLKLDYNWKFMKRCYDVNALFKGFKLNLKPDNNNLLAYQLSMNTWKQKGLKSSVSYVAKEFGLEFDENRMHDGAYDVGVIYNNFFELIKKIDIK